MRMAYLLDRRAGLAVYGLPAGSTSRVTGLPCTRRVEPGGRRKGTVSAPRADFCIGWRASVILGKADWVMTTWRHSYPCAIDLHISRVISGDDKYLNI